jgi:uncharacterized membrane protein
MTRRFYPPERLGALTDGVFAIALTLLVLELKLPDPPPEELTLAEILTTDWHPFLGWIISFVVLARLWLIQHDTAASLTKASSHTVAINMLFLGTISLIPFTAHLVSVYELEEPLSLQLFALLIGLNSLVLGWFLHSAERDQAFIEGRDPRWSKRALHHLIGVPIVAAIALLATFIAPALALIVWAVESIAVVLILLTSGRVDEPVGK